MLAMTLQIEPRHDLSPDELDAVEVRLYDHNRRAVRRHDGRGLGFVIRNAAGQIIGVAAWLCLGWTSELRQMWVDAEWRGSDHARIVECFCRGAIQSRRSPDLGGEV